MNDRIGLLLAVLACAALLIRVGMGWYAAGLSRSKNAAGAVLRNVCDMAVAAIVFWAIGAAMMNGDAGLLFDAKGRAGNVQFLQIVLVLIATAPTSGAVSERCRFFPMLVAPLLLAGLIVPIAGNIAWSGFLHRMGFVDIAGASVIHVAGGLCAAVAAIVVGPRSGKYNTDGSSNLIPGHNAAMASVGVLLMTAGWAPYVLAMQWIAGPQTDRAAINVILAASAGALMSLFLSRARYGKADIMLTYSGMLGALVAITAGGGMVSTLAAIVTGAVAGAIVPTATVLIDLVWKIDDPTGGVAIHAIGGALGTLAAGLFVPVATIGDRFKLIVAQTVGLIVIAILSLALSLVVFAALKKTSKLRLSEDAEFDGADLAEHDVNAYPDFQQTMIKSYHLREA